MLAMSREVAFAYSLLPQMAVVTSIHPAAMEGWSGTSISRHGKIEAEQTGPHPMFWEFVAGRASHAMSLSPSLSISEGRRRMERALEADPEKVLKSESMKLMMKDEDGERGAKMRSRGMPDMIIRLAEYVIGRAEGAYGADTVKNESARWATRRIADVLASLPRDDAERVSYEIENAIDKAKRTGEYVEKTITTGHIWVVFMVCHNAIKTAQHKKIEDKIERLQLQQTGTNTPIAVFSMNLVDDQCSFESGFALG